MFYGSPPGVTADTQGLWRFRYSKEFPGNVLLDDSGNGNVLVATGNPGRGGLPYGHSFKQSANGDYYTITSTAGLGANTDITIDICFVQAASGTEEYLWDERNPGGNDRCQIYINSSGLPVFRVWDALQTAYTVTSLDAVIPLRPYHLRVELARGSYQRLFLDGRMCGNLYATAADLASTSLNAPVLGYSYDTGGGSPGGGFIGEISEVRYQDVAVNNEDRCPINLDLSRAVTRKQKSRHEIDSHQYLQNESWTDDTLGGFNLSSFSQSLILNTAEQIAGVFGRDTGETTETELTRVYNITDLRSQTDVYFFDEVAKVLHVGDDPTTDYAEMLRVDITMNIGDDIYLSSSTPPTLSLMSGGHGELQTPTLFEPYPTGNGTEVAVSAINANFPAEFSSAGTGVSFLDADVRSYVFSDHVAPIGHQRQFTGRCEKNARVDHDQALLSVLPRYSKFHQAKFASVPINLTDWPLAAPDSLGKTRQVAFGSGLERVEFLPLETVTVVVGSSTYTFWKFYGPAHKIASIDKIYINDVYYPTTGAINFDLNNPSFIMTFIGPTPPSYKVTADISGYGTPTTPTSTPLVWLGNFGDPTDCQELPTQIIKNLLSFVGFTAADFNAATITDTDTRVQVELRILRSIDSPGAFVETVDKVRREALIFLYQERGGLFGIKDLNKASPADWVLHDEDIIDFDVVEDDSTVASSVNGLTHERWMRGNPPKAAFGKPFSITCNVDANLGDTKEAMDLGETGFKNVTSGVAMLEATRSHYEKNARKIDITLHPRFSQFELMHCVLSSGVALPLSTGETKRFRITQGQLDADGLFRARLESEQNYAADGSSPVPLRSPHGPVIAGTYQATMSDRLISGISGRPFNSASMAAIGKNVFIWPGAYRRAATNTHRALVKAKRVGGVTNADCKVQLRNLTTGDIVWGPEEIGTEYSIINMTADTIPGNGSASNNALLQLQGQTANGAVGHLSSFTWWENETSPPETIPPVPGALVCAGYAGGFSLYPVSDWTTLPWPLNGWGFMSFYTGGYYGKSAEAWIHCDPGGGSIQFRFVTSPPYIFPGVITALTPGFHRLDVSGPASGPRIMQYVYSGGSVATITAFSVFQHT